MKLTQKQTDKILEKLEDYGFKIFEVNESRLDNPQIISEEYFYEKVNEALR